MSDIPATPEFEIDLLAAEYVIGLLDLLERTAAATRITRDTLFAARVEEWEERLSGLNDGYDEVAAPNLMPQIEARLFPQAPAPARRGIFGNLWAWGSAAAAAVAVVAYLALTPASPTLTTTMASADGALRYEATVTGDEVTLTRVAGNDPDATHSYELWVIVGTDAPKSLGVIPDDVETVTLTGAAAGQTLAISLEPLGGSPNGAPTEVLMAGPLTSI